jgi:hypothetical protein
MSDERSAETPPAEKGSVFGKLPAARPGTRSPRRASAAQAKSVQGGAKPKPAKPKAGTSPPKTKTSSAKTAPPPHRARREPAAPPPAEEEQGGRGLDELAWAGVAAAAEAATLGVRLANRAIGALRDSVDRR